MRDALVGTGGLAIGAGMTALISFIVAKAKLSDQRHLLRNISVSKENLQSWQAELSDRFDRMHIDAEGQDLKTTFMQAVGIQNLDGPNPTINPLCIEIINDFQDKAIKGQFIGESGAVLRLFDAITSGVTDYLLKNKVLAWDGSNSRYHVKAGQLSQGAAAMIMFGNELCLLILRLSQVANRVSITAGDKSAKYEKIKNMVGAIHLSIEEAFKINRSDRKKDGLLRVNATGFGRILKDGLGAVFGYHNGRVDSMAFLEDSIAEATDAELNFAEEKRSIIERLADVMFSEAELKTDEFVASEFTFAAHHAMQESYKAAMMATQNADSKAAGPGVPAQVYFEGYVSKNTVFHRSAKQVELTLNRDMWEYMRRCFDANHQKILALPHGNPKFETFGDLSAKTKFVGKSRSADFVSEEAATGGMLLWSDIAFLRGAFALCMDAYGEEVRNGSGANSADASFFQQCGLFLLNQIKALSGALADDTYFTQLINRTMHHYEDMAGEKMHASDTLIPLGVSQEILLTRQAQIRDFYGTNKNQSQNLEAITKMPASTLATSLRKEAAWHVYVTQRLQENVSVKKVKVNSQSMVGDWSIDSARLKAWSLMATLMANATITPSERDSGARAFHEHTQGLLREYTAYQGSASSVFEQHKQLTSAYKNTIESANAMLDAINDFFAQAKVDSKLKTSLKKQIEALFQSTDTNDTVRLRFFNLTTSEKVEHTRLTLSASSLVNPVDYRNIGEALHAIKNCLDLVIKQDRSLQGKTLATKAALESLLNNNSQNKDLIESYAIVSLEEKLAAAMKNIQGAQAWYPALTAKQVSQQNQATHENLQSEWKQLEKSVKSLADQNQALVKENAQKSDELEAYKKKFESFSDEIQTSIEGLSVFKTSSQSDADKQALGESVAALRDHFSMLTIDMGSFRSKAIELSSGLLISLKEMAERYQTDIQSITDEVTSISDGIDARIKEKQTWNTSNLQEEINGLVQQLISSDEKDKINAIDILEQTGKNHLADLVAIKSQVDMQLSFLKDKLEKFKGFSQVHDRALGKLTELKLLDDQISKTQKNLSDAVKTISDRVDTLSARVTQIEDTVKAVQSHVQKVISDAFSMVQSELDTHNSRANLSLSGGDAEIKNKVQLSTRVRQASAPKKAIIDTLLMELNSALKELKVSDKNSSGAQIKVINALSKLFAAAHMHRTKVASPLAPLSKSSKTLAQLILPKDPEKKKILIQLLKSLTESLTKIHHSSNDSAVIELKVPKAFQYIEMNINKLVEPKGKSEFTDSKFAKLMKAVLEFQFRLQNKGEALNWGQGSTMINDSDWESFVNQFTLQSLPSMAPVAFAHRSGFSAADRPVTSSVQEHTTVATQSSAVVNVENADSLGDSHAQRSNNDETHAPGQSNH
jgi:hypothetical protein